MGSLIERLREDGARDHRKLKTKLGEYKEKVRKANASINLLAQKIALAELEKRGTDNRGSREDEGIVKGGYNMVGGRDSYASNRGSEGMIIEAIHNLENDKAYHEEIKRLSMEKFKH